MKKSSSFQASVGLPESGPAYRRELQGACAALLAAKAGKRCASAAHYDEIAASAAR
jgi:hypothetical protein